MAETVLPGLPGLEQIELVGRGASGSVFRAWQPQAGRWVAVKVLAEAVDAETAERFQRECRALGGLSGHPFVVPLYDAGFLTDGRPYLVMPYLAAGSLSDALTANGPAPVGRVLDVGVKVASALEAAHGLGVLHRDVKPDNILLTQYGEPQLADFGIARLEAESMTKTGTYAGTPLHTAPEVLNGGRATVSSDVYGLGSTLFRLLAGHAAFALSTDEALFPLLRRIESEPVPDLRPMGVPDAVATVIERAMAKAPGDRQANARALAVELQRAQISLGAPASVAPDLPTPSAEAPPPAPPAALLVPQPAEQPSLEATHLGDGSFPPPPLPPVPAATGGGGARNSRVLWVVGAVAIFIVAGVVIALVASGGGKSTPTALVPSPTPTPATVTSAAPTPAATSDAVPATSDAVPATSAVPTTAAATTAAASSAAAPSPGATALDYDRLGASLTLFGYGSGVATMEKGPVTFNGSSYTISPAGTSYTGSIGDPNDMDHTVRFPVSDSALFVRPDGTVYGTIDHVGADFTVAMGSAKVTFADLGITLDNAGKASALTATPSTTHKACAIFSLTGLTVAPATKSEEIQGVSALTACGAAALNDTFPDGAFKIGAPLGKIVTIIATKG